MVVTSDSRQILLSGVDWQFELAVSELTQSGLFFKMCTPKQLFVIGKKCIHKIGIYPNKWCEVIFILGHITPLDSVTVFYDVQSCNMY